MDLNNSRFKSIKQFLDESIGATAWFESVQSCQQHLGSLQKVLQSILNKLIQIDRIQCCIRLKAIVQSILVNNLLNSIQLYKIVCFLDNILLYRLTTLF